MDSCIFIAWLTRDTRYPLAAIGELFEDFRAGRIRICTSTVTRIEVLESKNRGNYQDFLALRAHPNFTWVQCTSRVADDSFAIRELLMAAKPGITGGKITTSTPDSIHLASAVDAECTVFYTLDGIDPKEHLDRKLLNLGELAFGGLTIPIKMPECRPEPPQGAEAVDAYGQYGLFSGAAEEEDTDDEESADQD